MVRPELATFHSLPRDEKGPVFRRPWEAQAFVMTVALHERGLFTWPEWANALSAGISAAQAEGDADLGGTYYMHWLGALEHLIVTKGVTSPSELRVYQGAWHRAAVRTPHGHAIDLHPTDFEP